MKKRALKITALVAIAAASAMAQKIKNDKEGKAIQEIQKAKTPDEIIEAVDKFVIGFTDSDFKSQALSAAAEAAEQKGDWKKAINYGDLSIQADPKNIDALLLVSAELAQHTPENALTKEEDFGKAQKYAEQALEAIPAAVKPNEKIPDAQWEAAKKDYTARAHGDLGMIASKRKKWELAATEFKTAVDTEPSPDSVLMVRLGNAYIESGKPADGLVVLNKVLAMNDLNPAVKKFAESEKARAEKLKK